jgi:hypothetical protein
VSDPAGQAPARHVGWRIAAAAHWLAHHLGAIVLAVAVMLGTGIGALAWRLSQGPLPSPFLAHWLERAASADNRPTTVHIGTASLAWAGFTQGVGSPLVIRLDHISATDAAGHTVMQVPAAEAALSLPQLLLGKLRPTEVVIDHPELRVRDDPVAGVTLDLGGPAPLPGAAADAAHGKNPGNALLAEMTQPARTDSSAEPSAPLERLSHLRRLRITAADVTVADARLGVTWRAPAVSIDLRRDFSGGVVGQADALLALGRQQARLTARADLAPGGETGFSARLDDVTPAALAADAPKLNALQALDAPVTLAASGTLGRDFVLRSGRLEARIGAGTLRLGAAPIQLGGVHLVVTGSTAHPVLDTLRIEVAASPTATPTVVDLSGQADRTAAGWQAVLALSVDQLAFADLPVLWPEIPNGPGARKWLVQNLTAGTARHGAFRLGLTAPADLGDVTLASASGAIAAEDATVHWLRPVPPVEHAAATLRVLDPDTLDIEFLGGRQHPSLPAGPHAPAAIDLKHGDIRISGIVHPHQLGLIEADLAGSLQETIALLRDKRLHLLDRHPVPLKDAQGEVSLKLNVRMPLEDNVQIDDIGIRVAAHLDAVHVAAIAAGRDLDQGALDLTADNDGLKVQGRAEVAGFATQLGVEMDFRAGPPSQVVQKVTASGQAQAAQLARIGLDGGTVLAGTVGLQASYQTRRDASGEIGLTVDLTDAALTALMLDWRKPAGSAAHAALHALLDHDRLVGVDHLSVVGDGIAAEGHAEYVDGRPAVLRLDHMALGRSDAAGSIRFPPQPGAPILVAMSGRQIDLSARFSQHESAAGPAAGAPEKVDAGTPYVVDARFERALMSRGQTMSDLRLHAENDGKLFQRARLEGQAGPAAPFRLEISPERGGRRLAATAADAGQLLRALDIMDGMLGGQLAINARYADGQPGRPLAGTMSVHDFRLRNAPFMARLLQGMTLYGLANIINGPGLEFTRLEAPFSLANDVLNLGESRMFNSALGLTARGTLDLSADTAELTGTIVPAYFFNSLLGRVPLVGHLFSPESGSGVFAANYSVRGRLADPAVSINPLSALTPGFLRNVFGIF